jgi:hypothetical protein
LDGFCVQVYQEEQEERKEEGNVREDIWCLSHRIITVKQ